MRQLGGSKNPLHNSRAKYSLVQLGMIGLNCREPRLFGAVLTHSLPLPPAPRRLPAETGMWDPASTGGGWGGPADVKQRCWERVLNQAGVNFKALGL